MLPTPDEGLTELPDDTKETAVANSAMPQCAQTHHEPSDLDVAISVAQQLLDSDQVLSLREALRLLLRALDAEPARRCPAVLPNDTSPCDGPIAVLILALTPGGVAGCEHHAARLLASAPGAYPVALPHAPDGAAIRVFKASSDIRGGRQ